MDAIFTLPQLPDTAARLWQEGRSHKVWAFHAAMGTGKTTLIHAVCEVLGITKTVSSPTFAIIQEYLSPVAGVIYHMDWYRLQSEEEAWNAGVDDLLHSGLLCLVEWPEQAPGLLPPDTWHIFMEIVDPDTRRLYTSDNLG
jgi:tRNA threonylcarbamoyladenosine biosynthesis protein TsaE